MRHPCVLAALLAASETCLAQPGATLYGIVDAGLRAALLPAPRVTCSDSANGEYIKRQLMDKLGIRRRMEGKAAPADARTVEATGPEPAAAAR